MGINREYTAKTLISFTKYFMFHLFQSDLSAFHFNKHSSRFNSRFTLHIIYVRIYSEINAEYYSGSERGFMNDMPHKIHILTIVNHSGAMRL